MLQECDVGTVSSARCKSAPSTFTPSSAQYSSSSADAPEIPTAPSVSLDSAHWSSTPPGNGAILLPVRTTNRVFWVQQVIIKYILDMSALDLAVQLVHASTLDLETLPSVVQLVHRGSRPPLALSGTLVRPWQDLGHFRATLFWICPTSCRPRIWVSGTRRRTHRYLHCKRLTTKFELNRCGTSVWIHS